MILLAGSDVERLPLYLDRLLARISSRFCSSVQCSNVGDIVGIVVVIYYGSDLSVYFFVLPCLFDNVICVAVLLKILFWCSCLEEARHREIGYQGTIVVFVCERTKHMV